MLTGSDGTTYEPLHFTFFFALSCKVTLARCHRHLLVSKAPKPSSIKIGVGGLDARLHQMAGEGARRRTDLEPIVSKLTFTGSTEAGKLPMEQRVGTVKKLSLELGGNAPFIVFDDADIEMAVKGAIAWKYRNAGQTCVCANRILMQDGVYDAFTKRLAETAGAMKVADGFEPGAVIDADRHEGGREGRGAHRRRGQEGRQGGHWRQARRARRQLLRAERSDPCDDAKSPAKPTAPNHKFGYYGVPGLDTMLRGKGVTRAAGILGSAIVAAGFEPSVPRRRNRHFSRLPGSSDRGIISPARRASC